LKFKQVFKLKVEEMADILSGEKKKQDHHKKFDIYRIDYPWIEKATNMHEMKLAHETLVEDGGYPDLLKTLEARMMEVDPSFKRKMEANHKLTSDEQKVINDEMGSFLDDIKKTDHKLTIGGTEEASKAIFGENSTTKSG